MKMIKKTLLVASVLSTMGIASSAFAAVSASEAAKLGNELTPSGEPVTLRGLSLPGQVA